MSTAQESKALVRRLVEIVNERDLDSLEEVASGDIAEQARGWIGPFRDSFPDFRMEVEDVIAEDDKVVAYFKCSGTHLGEWRGFPPSGRRFEGVDEIYIFRVENGKLSAATAVVEDNLTRLQQLGLDRSTRMRLPNTAHTSRPWRIHELTHDFRLEDVWALPTPGGPDDFPRLVQLMASGDPAESSSRAARTLWAIRWKVGDLLGWDRPDGSHGWERPTLRDRLPADLREGPSGPDFEVAPFSSLYLLDDEWAAEIVNRTVHGVSHVGWVPDETGGYRGEMAVYVKPNGLLGTAYMAAIRPLRHLIVYPPLMREIERKWRAGARRTGST